MRRTCTTLRLCFFKSINSNLSKSLVALLISIAFLLTAHALFSHLAKTSLSSNTLRTTVVPAARGSFLSTKGVSTRRRKVKDWRGTPVRGPSIKACSQSVSTRITPPCMLSTFYVLSLTIATPSHCPPSCAEMVTHPVVVNDLHNGSELSLARPITDEDHTSDLDVTLEGALRRLGGGGHGCRTRAGSAYVPSSVGSWSLLRLPSPPDHSLVILRTLSLPPHRQDPARTAALPASPSNKTSLSLASQFSPCSVPTPTNSHHHSTAPCSLNDCAGLTC